MNANQNRQPVSETTEWRNADLVLPPVGQLCEVLIWPQPTEPGEGSSLQAALVRVPYFEKYCWANGEDLDFLVTGVRWWRPIIDHPAEPQ